MRFLSFLDLPDRIDSSVLSRILSLDIHRIRAPPAPFFCPPEERRHAKSYVDRSCFCGLPRNHGEVFQPRDRLLADRRFSRSDLYGDPVMGGQIL